MATGRWSGRCITTRKANGPRHRSSILLLPEVVAVLVMFLVLVDEAVVVLVVFVLARACLLRPELRIQ